MGRTEITHPLRSRFVSRLGLGANGRVAGKIDRGAKVVRQEAIALLQAPGTAAVIAGVAGGAAMAVYEMFAAWTLGMGPLSPLRLIGAAHPGRNPVLTGAMLHLVTAAFWGIQLGRLFGRVPAGWLPRPGVTIALGILWGAALWVVMGLLIGPLFSPLMVDVHPGHFLAGHLVYGLVSVAAWRTQRKRSTLVTQKVAART